MHSDTLASPLIQTIINQRQCPYNSYCCYKNIAYFHLLKCEDKIRLQSFVSGSGETRLHSPCSQQQAGIVAVL